MCKKILVTGAGGYVGDAVIEMLKHNHAFNLIYGIDTLLYRNEYVPHGILFRNLDIRDCADLIKHEQFDAIIHLAGIVGDGACAYNESWSRDINVRGTKVIVDAIKQYSPHTRMIFASSCSVFGASQKDELLTMDSPVNPLSHYAIHKLEGEVLVNGLPNYSIFRLGTLYGLSTPNARVRSDLVANIMTFRAVENKDLQVFGGQQWRPLLHVKHAASIFVNAAECDKTNHTSIAASRNVTIRELADTIVKATKSESRVIETPTKFEDCRNYKVECRYKDILDFENSLAHMANAYRKGMIKNPWHTSYHNANAVKEIVSGPNKTPID